LATPHHAITACKPSGRGPYRLAPAQAIALTAIITAVSRLALPYRERYIALHDQAGV